VERNEQNDWVKKCMDADKAGIKPRGRGKQTWTKVGKSDMKRLGLA
jgi:hypothetical protein